MDFPARAAVHAALGDESRLRIVDALWLNDMSPVALQEVLGVDSNLLSHHLSVLERVGIIFRTTSSGDARRRYVSARLDVLDGLMPPRRIVGDSVLFICSQNSARSQLAAALMGSRADVVVDSAGPDPSTRAHPKAVAVAAEGGLDISGAVPKGYEAVGRAADVVVSVCDRALESEIPFAGTRLHWSIPDPAESNRLASFRHAFDEISRRVDRLADAMNRGER